MTYIDTKSRYHIALDGVGLLLQGAPDRPAYMTMNAPVYGTRFASGDRDYNDLSQWWYFIQTDWAGGIKDEQSWEDDAKFYYSSNIDAYSLSGAVKLLRKLVLDHTFDENIVCGVETPLSPELADTGWKSPSANVTGRNLYGSPANNWSNPANAYASNNTRARANQGGQAYGTVWTGFGFAIPTDATITGIEVRTEARWVANPSSGTLAMSASLVKDATVAADLDAAWPNTRSFPVSGGLTNADVVYTRGGASDLWGKTWVPADFNSANFGVNLTGNTSSSPTTTDYEVDHVELRVYYRLAGADNLVYIGTDNSGAGGQPILYKVDGLGDFTDVSTADYTNTNRTNITHLMAPKGALWVHTDTTAANFVNVINLYTGSAFVDMSTYITGTTGLNITPQSSRCGCGYGSFVYLFIENEEQGYALVSTSTAIPSASSNFSLVFQTSKANTKVVACAEFQGDIYYLVAQGAQMELRQYSIVDDIDVSLRIFKNTNAPTKGVGDKLLVSVGGVLVITIPDTEVWVLKGGILNRVLKITTTKSVLGAEAFGNLARGAVIADNRVWWGNLVYDPINERFYNNMKDVTETVTATAFPLFVDINDTVYFIDSIDQTDLYTNNYKTGEHRAGASNSAFLVFSQLDKLQSIDKLLHTLTLGFERFNSGDEIRVYYTTNPTPAVANNQWTLLGTANHTLDGGTVVFKDLEFPVGTIAKKLWFRVELSSSGGASSPILTDLTLEYLPMPDYKKQWQINANCADEVKDLAGRLVETTARELKGRLEQAWLTKSSLTFQDLDFAKTTVSDNPLTPAATTITVPSTNDFPERGRLRVGDEEIIYTNKTPTQFTGCVRGTRGTRASTHTTGAVVHNGYRVLITGIETRAPILLEDKNLEYTFGLNLREV